MIQHESFPDVKTPEGSRPIVQAKPRIHAPDEQGRMMIDPLDAPIVRPDLYPSMTTHVANAYKVPDTMTLQSVTASASDAVDASTTAAAVPVPPLYLFYHIVNPTGEIYYTNYLKMANEPNVHCQMCAPDMTCPCMMSCGFNTPFNTLITPVADANPTPSYVAAAPPPPPPPPASPPAAKSPSSRLGGLFKSVVSNVSTMAASAAVPIVNRGVYSQQLSVQYVQIPSSAPVEQKMDINQTVSAKVWSEHDDVCCILIYIHWVHKKQKHIGIQLVALTEEEGQKAINAKTFYRLTAC